MKITEIVQSVAIMGEDYCLNAEKNVNEIEKFMDDNGFKEIESHDNGRWSIYKRDSIDKSDVTDEITIHFDVEHNRVGVSYHEYCKKCGDALDALGDSIDVCVCTKR